MDFDALFAMPSFMPGYYNIQDSFFASDGKLYDSKIPLHDVTFVRSIFAKPFLKRRRRGCPKYPNPHYERKRVRQLYEAPPIMTC